jgi:hypothetical protein
MLITYISRKEIKGDEDQYRANARPRYSGVKGVSISRGRASLRRGVLPSNL